MKVAVYGKQIPPQHTDYIRRFFDLLEGAGIDTGIFSSFVQNLGTDVPVPAAFKVLEQSESIQGYDFLISVGGDGTMLETATVVRDSGIPVLGINTGRLGFLSHVDADKYESALHALVNGRFTIDRRSLLQVSANNQDLGNFPFALNEVTILNQARNSMISIHVFVNDQFMSTYWADGLIIATPTGSTAYSLSCGGPIVTPDSSTCVLTPIAAHNLNVRPVVISDSNRIALHATGRDDQFLLSLDSRSFLITESTRLEITRAPFQVNLVRLEGQGFFNTIHTKLGWAVDKRN
ncbi:MAG: NAD kinase [Flavobacteriales bacterium]|nr:NAD kinase [Flavobacteriales bacterium]